MCTSRGAPGHHTGGLGLPARAPGAGDHDRKVGKPLVPPPEEGPKPILVVPVVLGVVIIGYYCVDWTDAAQLNWIWLKLYPNTRESVHELCLYADLRSFSLHVHRAYCLSSWHQCMNSCFVEMP